MGERSINIPVYDKEYFIETECNEDGPKYYDLGRTIAESFQQCRTLDIGCGRGWLVKHLVARGIDAFGIDSSHWAISNSVTYQNCSLCDAHHLDKFLVHKYDVIVLQDVCQTFELQDLVEVIDQLTKICMKYVVIVDKVVTPQLQFALDRDVNWYLTVFNTYGWHVSKLQAPLKALSGKSNLLVLTREQTKSFEETEPTFIDPWLVHHDNTALITCTLTTNEFETAAFEDSLQDIPITPHFVDQGESEDRVERERLGVTRGCGDYVFVSEDTTRLSRDWLFAALAKFRDPSIGAVVSPLQLKGETGHGLLPDYDYWSSWPMMFRVLAYQQSQGSESKFNELGWKVAQIKTPLLIREPSSLRDFKETPVVTIITAFDDSKDKILSLYLKTLLDVDYDHDSLRIVFFDDSKETNINVRLRDFIQIWGDKFDSITLRKARTDDYWLQMKDDKYYRWEGVNYPISVLVAGIYNRAVQLVTSERLLLWESDTIPTSSDFLKELVKNLKPQDGAISGHYMCRIEKKSLAWNIETEVPFVWSWAPPSSGVQSIGATPHGLLLMNTWCLEHFKFSVLANDPRDYRGLDLVMGRDFRRLSMPLKIHWDVRANHHDPDGVSFLEV